MFTRQAEWRKCPPGCEKVQVTPCASLRTILYVKGENAQLTQLDSARGSPEMLTWTLIHFEGRCGGSVEKELCWRMWTQCVGLVGWGLLSAVCPQKTQEKNDGLGWRDGYDAG